MKLTRPLSRLTKTAQCVVHLLVVLMNPQSDLLQYAEEAVRLEKLIENMQGVINSLQERIAAQVVCSTL
jgi:hypothetical protein